MRILLIDNHDSFSAILHHYLWELAGERPAFFRNDALARDELEALEFDAAVLSPGPGHPANVRDFGVCRDLLDLFPHKPVLGVCLGMQGMAHFAGARVVPLADARHGRPSRILHDGSGIFRGLPPEFAATRYHSLVVDPESLPENVRVTARAAEDGHVMAVSFTDRPWHGVQFHPESVGTEHGMKLLSNFLDLAKPDRVHAAAAVHEETPNKKSPQADLLSAPLHFVELSWREPEEVFEQNFSGVSPAFWLDGAQARAESGWPATVMGRADSVHAFSTWDSFRIWANEHTRGPHRTPPWPGYRGGPVGHLAYELHRDTVANNLNNTSNTKRANTGSGGAGSPAGAATGEPLARWMLPEGWLVFDHGAGKVYAAWEGGAPPAWLETIRAAWDVSRDADSTQNPSPVSSPVSSSVASYGALPPFTEWTPLLKEADYQARVLTLQEAIARGETYEACLTHAWSAESDADPCAVFLRMRARNPAPYAAYLAFPDVRVLSASPELFLELSADGELRSRPIKGTRRRGGDPEADRTLREDLRHSEKDAAENRMIVDLTRHDFARVCNPGSVETPSFLTIEDHPAVFQMVSEVRGRLAPATSPLEAIAACFPGGSMTGAPKERTVEILAALESEARGIYSGALGFLARDGVFTLSMVIRTLERRGNVWRAGGGGAVLADSDPAAEWREAVVKARSVIDAAAG